MIERGRSMLMRENPFDYVSEKKDKKSRKKKEVKKKKRTGVAK